jgi:hypothetical protein
MGDAMKLGERHWRNDGRCHEVGGKTGGMMGDTMKLGERHWRNDGRCHEVGQKTLEECCKKQGQMEEASEEGLGSKWAVVPMMIMVVVVVVMMMYPFLSLCRRGFQDLLKVKPSSLLMLCGCISS